MKYSPAVDFWLIIATEVAELRDNYAYSCTIMFDSAFRWMDLTAFLRSFHSFTDMWWVHCILEMLDEVLVVLIRQIFKKMTVAILCWVMENVNCDLQWDKSDSNDRFTCKNCTGNCSLAVWITVCHLIYRFSDTCLSPHLLPGTATNECTCTVK